MEWNPEPVEAKIGIQFKTRETLHLALIHRSYAQQVSEPDTNNERLQFLGNAILDFVITDYLYQNCPYLEMDNLLALRDKLLEPERLTKLWFQLGLGQAYPFLALEEQRYRLQQQRHNPFEEGFLALVGAIHLDRGFWQTRNWLIKYLIAPLLERHLKKSQERCTPNKQIKFLSDSLFKAIITDYLYRFLPGVSNSRLAGLYRELASRDRLTEYRNKITPAALTELNIEAATPISKSVKIFLSTIYLQFSASEPKRAFSKTSEWFLQYLVDQDDVLRRAITLLLEDGKSQKWIIRQVMGYESKDYNEGRERFNAVMEGETI